MTLRILHVGPGHMPLPAWLAQFDETRLDIDPALKPDIVADMRDMGDIGEFNFVYSSHNLEHLYPHDVPKALAEFYRVLVPGGVAIISVPDLGGVEPSEDVLYMSPMGPVCGIDMIYGMRAELLDQPYMAHHTGFVEKTLRKALEDAGFEIVNLARQPAFTLSVMAKKPYSVTEAATLPIPADPQVEGVTNAVSS